MAIENLSHMAQYLNDLLLVAGQLERELPGSTSEEKLKANLNKIFIKMTKEGLAFEQKGKSSWFARILEGRKGYSIKESYTLINQLFSKMQNTTVKEIEAALKELHVAKVHEHIDSATDALLLFKERWNAIITHIAHEKEEVPKFDRFKITWTPNYKRLLQFANEVQEKLFKKGELLPATDKPLQNLTLVPQRSLLRKSGEVPTWLKPKMPSVKSIERLRRLDIDELRGFFYGLVKSAASRSERLGAKSEKNKTRAENTIKKLSSTEFRQLVNISKDDRFLKEIESVNPKVNDDAIQEVQRLLGYLKSVRKAKTIHTSTSEQKSSDHQ